MRERYLGKFFPFWVSIAPHGILLRSETGAEKFPISLPQVPYQLRSPFLRGYPGPKVNVDSHRDLEDNGLRAP